MKEMKREEVERKIESMKKRRRLLSKILLLISMILIAFILILVFMIYYAKIGFIFLHYLPISLSTLSIIFVIIIALFAVIEILLHLDFKVKKRKLEATLKPKPVLYKGKKLYTFTYPEGARGGVFSKTIIDIDDQITINLRYQVLKPQDIWK